MDKIKVEKIQEVRDGVAGSVKYYIDLDSTAAMLSTDEAKVLVNELTAAFLIPDL